MMRALWQFLGYLKWRKIADIWFGPQHEWHHTVLPGRMKRKINGEWQYREETDAEVLERLSMESW
jgi:hypothetical protein